MMARVNAAAEPRFGIDARWISGGPPSGRNYVRSVVVELGKLPDASALVAFVRPDGADRPEVSGLRSIKVPASPSMLFNLVGIPSRVPRTVQAVVHQNFTPPLTRGAVVTVVHDLIFLSSPAYFSPLERAYFGLIPALLPRADIVVAVSEHVADQVRDRWPGRDPATVMTAPNGVSDRLIEAAGRSDREDGSLARMGVDRPYLLYLGRLNVRKNLVRLIRAFAASSLSDHLLVISGAEDGRTDDLRAAARDSKVEDRVRLTGRVEDNGLDSLLGGADALAYVSLDEGFGVPPLEAMAFGIPVVASDIPPLRETAGPGGALLVPPTDIDAIRVALEKAVLDHETRERAARLGPTHARTYRWSRTAACVLRALQAAAGDR